MKRKRTPLKWEDRLTTRHQRRQRPSRPEQIPGKSKLGKKT